MNKLKKMYENVRTAILGIHTIKNGNIIGSGAGFILEDYFVTNYHVVEKALNNSSSSQNNSEIMLTYVNTICEKNKMRLHTNLP